MHPTGRMHLNSLGPHRYIGVKCVNHKTHKGKENYSLKKEGHVMHKNRTKSLSRGYF